MTVSANEVETLLQSLAEQSENISYGEPGYNSINDYSNPWKAIKYNDVEFPLALSDEVFITATVAEYGGEGQGDEFWVVISVTSPSGTQLFRKDGWYASYEGGDLDGDLYEVEPVDKIVTYYERKK